MKFNYNNLRGLIISKFQTIENFSKELGVSFATVSKKLNGKSAFSQKDIVKWSELLEIVPDKIGFYFFAV